MAKTHDNLLHNEGIINDFGNSISDWIGSWLVDMGLSGGILNVAQVALIILALIIICFLSDFISRKIVLTLVERIIRKTKNTWDDVLVEKNVFGNVAHIVPAVVIGVLSPVLFKGHPFWVVTGEKVSSIYLAISMVLTFVAFLKAFQLYLQSRPFLKDKPLDSYTQLIRLIVYIIVGIYIISVLLDKSPYGVFSALGAMSVVLMLVFKDTILGFVGSIQIAANDMVKVGDWVEFPKYGADGDVLEIKLQTIKVQNWDKTVTTIPTYAFVSEAFKNWRGMEESGGRRIKRSLMIDMNTVKFSTAADLDKYKGVHYIQSYLEDKEKEVESHNTNNQIDLSNQVNGRRITNLGTFRAYVVNYLKNHPEISKEMTFLVRQLSPTEKGLPLEIYVFSKEQRWAQYEDIQSDIFDHILSVLNEFDLAIFQNPTGLDLQSITKNS